MMETPITQAIECCCYGDAPSLIQFLIIKQKIQFIIIKIKFFMYINALGSNRITKYNK